MTLEKIVGIIEEARKEAFLCNSSQEIFAWIDWFEKKLMELV